MEAAVNGILYTHQKLLGKGPGDCVFPANFITFVHHLDILLKNSHLKDCIFKVLQKAIIFLDFFSHQIS